MDGSPNHYINHQTSTIFSTISTISHPLATMATTTTASTVNTTSSTSTPTTSHSNMQQNTTAAHIQFTAPSSTTISQPKTTPSDHSSSPSKHIPFNFHFIPSCPNYLTDINLPTKLAKLCRDIQLNAELSIVKVVEDHLKKQANIKKTNKNKNKNATTYKLRFISREHKPTPPTHTSHPTDTTTVIQNTQPISKQLTFTTTTHYNQPIHNTLTSTYTKLHPLLQCTIPSIHYQPNTNHITQTHTQAPSRNYHSLKYRSTPTTIHSTTHPHHQTPFQPTNKTHATITHPTTSIAAPRPSYTHRQHRHTPTHHPNKNNLATKIMHTNTTQPLQQTSHKIHQNRHQTNTIHP